MEEVMLAMLMWLNKQEILPETPLEDCCPQVRVVSGESIVYYAFMKKEDYWNFRATNPSHYETLKSDLLGIYDNEREIIYLNDVEDYTTLFGLSVLLHELVHWVQYHHGMHEKVECNRQLEPAAYWLQHKWLLDMGVPNKYDHWHVHMASLCPIPGM